MYCTCAASWQQQELWYPDWFALDVLYLASQEKDGQHGKNSTPILWPDLYTLSETASHESLTGLLVSGCKDTLDWFCVSLQQMYVKVLVIDVPSSL